MCEAEEMSSQSSSTNSTGRLAKLRRSSLDFLTQRRNSLVSRSSSFCHEENESKYGLPSIISDLITKRKWKRLIKLLETPDGKQAVLMLLQCNDESLKENALHLACQSRAPLQVIQILCKSSDRFALETNHEGQTPLHLAAANGACPDVIRYLLNENTAAATSKDHHMMTPLHLACANPIETFCIFDVDYEEPRPSAASIHALCQAAAAMVNEEDEDGMTAIEHAILENADLSTVQFLRLMSEHGWKESLSYHESVCNKHAHAKVETICSKCFKGEKCDGVSFTLRERKHKTAKGAPARSA